MRINKTEDNLVRLWKQLDDACGSLYNAVETLELMTNTPESIKKVVNQIDISGVVVLKNLVEELIVEKSGDNWYAIHHNENKKLEVICKHGNNETVTVGGGETIIVCHDCGEEL